MSIFELAAPIVQNCPLCGGHMKQEYGYMSKEYKSWVYRLKCNRCGNKDMVTMKKWTT